MANLRLTFVIEGLGGGGAQRVLSILTAALVDLGQQVCVVTYADSSADVMPLDPRIQRYSAQLGGDSRHVLGAISGNLRRIVSIRRMVRRSRPDIVIAFVGTTNILTLLACAGLGVPVVISERNDPSRQSLGRVWDVLRRSLYRRATLVTANSSAAIDAMRDYVADARLRLVDNPLPLTNTSREPETDAPYVLAVGRLHRQKGFDVLLEGFANFDGEQGDWRLVVLGEGGERGALQQQAKSLGIEERVVFPGFVDPAPFYRGCSMFVLPSRFEGVSNALLEAMGFGCPAIVTSSQAGSLGLIVREPAVLVVPPEDSGALADAMRALAADPVAAEQRGKAARQSVGVLAPRRIARAWLDLFEEVQRR
jgi:glycosyltransferase involved in cell wall biosynthesis